MTQQLQDSEQRAPEVLPLLSMTLRHQHNSANLPKIKSGRL